jgi:hypothetical protein
VVKWAFTPLALVLVCAAALLYPGSATAGAATFVSPDEGEAGSRFQIVGESGWVPNETLTIEFTFLDAPPAEAESFGGPFYRTEIITALRDGSWSFPVVINNEILPFPLWRPGYIAIKVSGSTQSTITLVTYLVDGERPAGTPPLADLGFGTELDDGPATTMITLAMFALGTGALLLLGGVTRVPPGFVYTSSPRSRRNASLFGSRPRKSRTSTSPSTLPPRSRILRR